MEQYHCYICCRRTIYYFSLIHLSKNEYSAFSSKCRSIRFVNISFFLLIAILLIFDRSLKRKENRECKAPILFCYFDHKIKSFFVFWETKLSGVISYYCTKCIGESKANSARIPLTDFIMSEQRKLIIRQSYSVGSNYRYCSLRYNEKYSSLR